MRYRLDVISASVADAVRSTGGLLYDRAMAGWEVNVLLPQHRSARPLQILGARVLDLESELAARTPGSVSLAVSADMFAANPQVRTAVLHALEGGLTEVTLWGDAWPVTVARRVGTVQHQLSAAARAFKACALAAAGIDCDAVDLTEEFRCDTGTGVPAESELVPVESGER